MDEDTCPRCEQDQLYVFENPNPQFKGSDFCTVRCVICGFGISWSAWSAAWKSPVIPYEDITNARSQQRES